MTRTFTQSLKAIFGALALAACFPAAQSFAQVEVDVGPPPEVMATLTPVYYEGRPAYWWNDRWYYRDGPRWGYYHDEPVYLRDWRGRRPEFAHPHYYGRGGWGGRGGGGRDRRR